MSGGLQPREKAVTFWKIHLRSSDSSAHNSLPTNSTGHQLSSLLFEPLARGIAAELFTCQGDLAQYLLVANLSLSPCTLPVQPQLNPRLLQALPAPARSGPHGSTKRPHAVRQGHKSHVTMECQLSADCCTCVTSLLRPGTLADGYHHPISQKR